VVTQRQSGDQAVEQLEQAPPTTWSFGMSVREILELPLMGSAVVLAGGRGIDRVVQRLNMMEVPDVLPWVRPGEMLVTSGYPLRDLNPRQLARLIRDLSARGLSGLCIKLGRFVSELAPSVLKAAEAKDFIIVSMPAELSFTDLLGAVLGEQLDRQEAALRASDEIDRLLLKILVEGGGHQEIAGSIASWVGVPVAIVDADGLILGAAPTGPREQLRVRGSNRVRLRGIPYDDADILAMDGSLAAACVRSGTAVQGYLIADAQTSTDKQSQPDQGPNDQQLSAGQLLAIRRATPVVALAFARANEILAVEARYRGDFLRAVLTATTRADEDVHEHAGLLGWQLEGDLLVLAGEPPRHGGGIGSGQASARIARILQREMLTRWPGVAVHGYASEIVAIAPAEAKDQLPAVLRTVRSHVAGAERDFRFGVSRPVYGAQEVPTGYRQAREALLVAVREGRDAAITPFDDIGLARVVAVMAESDQADEVVADALAPLLGDRNGEELLVTLERFLATNCNVAATARSLHFHYNTVRYRVARIEALVGSFVDDAERRAELMTACRLRHALIRRQ
jgi:purine catabolism regulator